MMEDKTIRFIRRERIRRNLINTKTGETICLQDWEIAIVLEWIKELERKVEENERQKHIPKYCKSPNEKYGRW